MIQGYYYERSRNTFVSRFYSRSRLVVIALVGLTMLGLQIVGVYYAAQHQRVVIVRHK